MMEAIPFWGTECVMLEAIAALSAAVPQLGGPFLSWWLHTSVLGCL
jgi:hypothetical protein